MNIFGYTITKSVPWRRRRDDTFFVTFPITLSLRSLEHSSCEEVGGHYIVSAIRAYQEKHKIIVKRDAGE